MGDAPMMYAPDLRDEADVIWVDGQPLTDEEREAAAVLVACMRRGWVLKSPHYGVNVTWTIHGPLMSGTRYHGDTPAEAYARAVESEDPHTTGGE